MKSFLPSNLRAPRSLAILAAIIFPTTAQAILDTNDNLLSDLWEKQHNNGNLFSPTILATNDEDQDGWTNAQEAAAGTDPFDPNPPDGIVTVTITPSLTAGAFTLTWPTLIGKNYQLKVSTDLVTWTNLGDPITTSQTTHSIGINTIQPDTTIPPKVFWQVVVSDLDTDRDGLTDAEEHALGLNPYLAFTITGLPDLWLATHFLNELQTSGIADISPDDDLDADGLTNINEASNDTNPKAADTDGDGLNDNNDADPNDPFVIWPPSKVSSYILIPIDDLDEYYACDINDKAEVLFPNKIWKPDAVIDLPSPSYTGPAQGENETYHSSHDSWKFMNNHGRCVGTGGTSFPEPYKEDLEQETLFVHDANEQQANFDFTKNIPMWNYANLTLRPIGITDVGEVVSDFQYRTYDDPSEANLTEENQLVIFNAAGTSFAFLPLPTDYEMTFASGFPNARVTPSGWITTLTKATSLSTGAPYKLALWNPAQQHVDLPAQGNGQFDRISLTELPNQKIGLIGVQGTAIQSQVFLPDINGEMQYSEKLSGKKLVTFAGDGTALSSDGKLWRNGKVIPMRDLCDKWSDYEADFQFHPLKGNKHGIYLIQATKIDTNNEQLTNKHFILVPVEVAVDNSRNAEITFDGEDETTAEKPYRFWINNDNDYQSNSNEDHPWTDSPDHESAAVESRRDLDDFARLHFMIGGLHDFIANGSMQLGVKWKETTEGSPVIRLFKATDEEGRLSYLKEEAAADTQMAESAIGTVSGSGTLTLPHAITSGLSDENPNLYFIYEGLSEGKGELTFVIIKDGEELGEAGALHLHLTDIRRMFERVKATPEQIDDPGLSRGSSSPPALTMGWDDDPWNYPFEEAWDEDRRNKRYVVFVHGWRMTYRGSRSFGITMFKRLWWENFKGRYSAFRWPTYASEQDHFGFIELEGQSKDALQAYLSMYNHSEYRAWKSGISLKKYMESLPSEYSKNLVAHSMGNIVGAGALREGLEVKNYALLQAAVPATCYDGRNDLYQNPSQLILPFGELNIPFLLWDFPMVGDDSVTSIRAMGYKEQIKNISGNLVNFYLPDDEATSFAWEFNNSVDKPVAVPGPHPIHYSYFYDPNPPAGATSKLWVAPPVRVITDAHESMAMIDRSKTKAVGAEGRTQGSVDSSINLDTDFGFQREHSAEFEWDIQRLGEFYKRLKDELEREE